ncbi:hypothetical protein Q7P37_010695 [Cladosporium fusiforme]
MAHISIESQSDENDDGEAISLSSLHGFPPPQISTHGNADAEDVARQHYRNFRTGGSGHVHAGNWYVRNYSNYASPTAAQIDSSRSVGRTRNQAVVATPERGVHPSISSETTDDLVCGLSRRKLYIGLLITAVLITGLSTGLTLGLRSSNETVDPSYDSTTGAWNGSGFALTDQGFLLHVYFQYHSGDLTWMYEDHGWHGNASNVLATDARDNTPVSAISYVSGGLEIVHVFLDADIDQDNIIRQRSGSNSTTARWQSGVLEKASLKAYNADRVALQACWESYEESNSVRLWHASDNATLEEYLWHEGDSEWRWLQTWRGYDGTAGIGCSNGDSQTSIFASFVNTAGRLELWAMNGSHITRKDDAADWVNTSLTLPNDGPVQSSKIAELLFVQMAGSNDILAYNFTWNQKSVTTTRSRFDSIENMPMVSHTYFNVVHDPYDGYYLAYQVNGSDISVSKRGQDGAQDTAVAIYSDD